MCKLTVIVPEHDPDQPEEYPGGIQPGQYDQNGIVALLRQHAEHPEAIRFIADMLEV